MAVYTEVPDKSLVAFLKTYDIGALVRSTPIAEGVENSNYRIDTDRGSFILTLFEKRVDEADLPFFMALKTHLAKKGMPVPTPIANKNGVIIGDLMSRPAVIVEFLSGRPNMAPDKSDCAAMGSILADLHTNTVDFGLTRSNPLSLTGWKNLAAACRNADKIEHGLASFIDDELGHIESAWPRELPSGVIHADLFPDNVFLDQHNVTGVIDFYFACTDFFAYDLAVCINAWCFYRPGQFCSVNSKAMLAAYTKKRPLSPAEVDAMPILLRGAGLRFLLTRTYDWLNRSDGALVTVKDPMTFQKIILFHRSARSEAIGF